MIVSIETLTSSTWDWSVTGVEQGGGTYTDIPPICGCAGSINWNSWSTD